MKVFERLGQALRQRLSSSKVILQSGSELSQLEAERFGLLWIVSRADCVFRKLDLAAVPASKRTQVLAAQISLLSPYKEPGYWYCIQNGVAIVWLWDEQHRLQLASEQQLARAEEYLVLPESCFTPFRDTGSVINSGVEGFFGQVWKAEGLVAETWWPQEPNELSWKQFHRGAGVAGTMKPEVSYIDLESPIPWASVRFNRLDSRSAESFLVKGLSAAFICLFVFQLTGSLRLLTEQWQLKGQIAEMQSQHQQSIAVRETAFELRGKAQYLQALNSGNQLEIFESIADKVPGGLEGRLIGWQYQDGLLEFVVRDDNPDLEAYVRNLEAIDLLSGVSVEPLTRAKQIKVNAMVSAR